MLPNWSCADTVKEKLLPAVGVAVLARASPLAGAARTVRPSVPMIVAVAVSVAVIVCEPALMSVEAKLP